MGGRLTLRATATIFVSYLSSRTQAAVRKYATRQAVAVLLVLACLLGVLLVCLLALDIYLPRIPHCSRRGAISLLLLLAWLLPGIVLEAAVVAYMAAVSELFGCDAAKLSPCIPALCRNQRRTAILVALAIALCLVAPLLVRAVSWRGVAYRARTGDRYHHPDNARTYVA